MKFSRLSRIHWFNVVLLVILVLCVLFFLVGRYQKYHAYAQINRIFASEASNSMKHNLTDKEVNRAVDALEYVDAEDYEEENRRVHLIEQKHEAFCQLKDMYDFQEESVEQIPDHLTFKKDLSADKMQEVNYAPEWLLEDEETKRLGDLLQRAHNDWQLISDSRSGLEEIEEDTLSKEGLQTLSDIGQELEGQTEHPQIEELQEEVKKIADEVLEEAETAYEEERLDREDLLPLLKWSYTADQMVDGPLDVRKVVSVTFDDGPDPVFTPLYLDLLNKYEIPGTFFLLGRAAEAYPEIVSRIVNEGHEVGNHSYSHADFATLTDQEIIDEITITNDIISGITGEAVEVYRMPYGSGGQRVTQLLPNMHSIMWNIDSEDWLTQNEEAIYNTIMADARDGAVILMHDRFDEGLLALERVIVSLLDDGYHFVPASENLLNFDYY